MTDSQKGTTTPANPKEKKSSLDDDIGMEFLSSWKSMSVMEDDTMEFRFDTGSTGKKKAFNFEKLDMDFSLEGDFDKLSSFKVDMPDLDFSSPARKAAKSKESFEGESAGGNNQRKQDRFTFSFDFNELENFNLDAASTEKERNCSKTMDSKGVVSNKNESRISKTDSVLADAFDDSQTEMFPALDNMKNSMVKTCVDGAATGDSLNANIPSGSPNSGDSVVSHVVDGIETSVSNVGTAKSSNDKFPSGSAVSGDLIVPHGLKPLHEETVSCDVVKEVGRKSNFLEKDLPSPTETHAQKTTGILPIQSFSEDDSAQGSEFHENIEVDPPCPTVNAELGTEQNLNERKSVGSGFICEGSKSKELATLCVTESESHRDTNERKDGETSAGDVTENDPAVDCLDNEATYTASHYGTMPHCSRPNKKIETSSSELLVLLGSGPTRDKVTPTGHKESGVNRSKYFGRSKKIEANLHSQSSSSKEASLFGRKGISDLHIDRPASGKREDANNKDAQIGGKLIGNLNERSMELTKGRPALLGSEKTAKSLCNIMKGSNAYTGPNGCKLVASKKPPDNEAKKGDSVTYGHQNGIKDLKESGGEDGPSTLIDKTGNSNTQMSVIPPNGDYTMGKIQEFKIDPVKGIKAVRKTCTPSLKASRMIGASKYQPNATATSEIHSTENLSRKSEIQGNKTPKIDCSISNADRKMSMISSLKRKAPEASNEDLLYLNPQKRTFQSPSEKRKFKECLGNIVEEQVSNHDNLAKDKMKNPLYDHPPSGIETAEDVNVKELDAFLDLENDGNVDKAEACSRELDGICNMLKKKHEEAKELLVRAMVNNNNLLMLNHPIFDEKIRLVQKFAALTTSH